VRHVRAYVLDRHSAEELKNVKISGLQGKARMGEAFPNAEVSDEDNVVAWR